MIIAANLKTNMTRAQTSQYIASLQEFINNNNVNDQVIVFPAASSLVESSNDVIVGAQNAYPVENGAFTGEIGVEHLSEFRIKTILIGHSERRHILGETQEELVKKFNFFKDQGFTIVYCIGEPLEERKASKESMMRYISQQYEGVDTSYEKLIIAYEPVWAIGTGLTPTLQEIEEIHADLKQKSTAPLLYGGSVKVANAKEVLSLNNVDGVLVGSAALSVEDFSQMILFAKNLT